MKTVSSKRLWRSFADALVMGALLAQCPTAAACSFSGWDCGTCGSFFAPEVIGDTGATPFFRTARAFYGNNRNDDQADVDDVNIKEWSKYFEGKLSDDDLRALVYKTSLAEVDYLIFSLQGKPASNGSALAVGLVPKLKAPQLAPRAVKALYYLGFAKRVEPLALKASAEDGWYAPPAKAKEPPMPAAEVKKRLAAAEKQAAAVGDDFLRQRYDLQSLRLLFYVKDFAQAIAFYEGHKGYVTDGSVKYRFMATAAGAYFRLKQYAPANYLYASVFSAFPPLKRVAYLSFHPQEEADWAQTLALAKTAGEKAQLWQLFGIYHDVPRAIREIHALDPKAPELPLLLVRAVNLAEETQPATATLEALKAIADRGDALKPEVWLLAVGHLYGLANNKEKATMYIDQAAQSGSTDPAFRQQLELSRVSTRLHAIPGVDAVHGAAQTSLAADLNWLRSRSDEANENGEAPADMDTNRARHLYSWVKSILHDWWTKSGDLVRAQLILPSDASPVYADNAAIDALAALINAPQKNELDTYLTSRPHPSQAELNHVKGINLLYAGKFAAAAEMLKGAGSRPLLGDPFLAHITDCHDCDHALPKKAAYSKAAFAQKMAELEAVAAKGTTEGAQAAFDLATGYYNMSYFGNARTLWQNSPAWISDRLDSHLDTTNAEHYYVVAAGLSKDREFQAKARFMAAKAERDRYYVAQNKDSWSFDMKDPYYAGEHFKALKDGYSDTQYYKDLIAECGMFKRFAKKK